LHICDPINTKEIIDSFKERLRANVVICKKIDYGDGYVEKLELDCNEGVIHQIGSCGNDKWIERNETGQVVAYLENDKFLYWKKGQGPDYKKGENQ